jgi:Gas vesicle synthesis protein GvpL/GvpF
VKLIADVDALREAAGAGPENDAEESGRAYFERRSRQRRSHEEAQRLGAQAATEVHERLRHEAAAATVLRPQSRELSGREGEMVLNGAYLVDRARVERFRAVAEELGERQRPLGLALEVTGPWPPYNFVELRGG